MIRVKQNGLKKLLLDCLLMATVTIFIMGTGLVLYKCAVFIGVVA